MSLSGGRKIGTQKSCDRGSHIHLFHVWKQQPQPNAGADHYKRFQQINRFRATVPAAVNLAMVGNHDDGIKFKVQRGNNLLQFPIGAFCGRIPARIERTALMMTGKVHLIKMDEHQLVIPGEHGQGGLYHGLVSDGIFAGSVKGCVHGGLWN